MRCLQATDMFSEPRVLGQPSCGPEFKCPGTHLHIKLGMVPTLALGNRDRGIIRVWWTTGLRNLVQRKTPNRLLCLHTDMYAPIHLMCLHPKQKNTSTNKQMSSLVEATPVSLLLRPWVSTKLTFSYISPLYIFRKHIVIYKLSCLYSTL